MIYLVWGGALLSLLGLVGVVYSILGVMCARRAGLPDAELRSCIAVMMLVNLGAFFAAMLGLMMVLVGVLLA